MESSQALLSEYVGSNVGYTGYASGKRYRKLSLTIEIKEVSIYATYLNIKQFKKNPYFCLPNTFQKNTEYFNPHYKIFLYITNRYLKKDGLQATVLKRGQLKI